MQKIFLFTNSKIIIGAFFLYIKAHKYLCTPKRINNQNETQFRNVCSCSFIFEDVPSFNINVFFLRYLIYTTSGTSLLYIYLPSYFIILKNTRFNNDRFKVANNFLLVIIIKERIITKRSIGIAMLRIQKDLHNYFVYNVQRYSKTMDEVSFKYYNGTWFNNLIITRNNIQSPSSGERVESAIKFQNQICNNSGSGTLRYNLVKIYAE